MTSDAQAARHIRLYRERCKKDLLFLGREVLGYELLRDDFPVMRKLAAQASFLGDTISLIPRSWCKSTVITVVGSIFYNLNYPQDCTLISSNTEDNAEKFLGEVTGHYKFNEKFRLLFPEFCPEDPGKSGTMSSFRCANQRPGRKEATFEATGMNSTTTSRHYERILIDDAVYKENVVPAVTAETMGKTWEYIRSLTALMKLTSSRCFRHIIGTRWHDADAYGQLLDDTGYEHFRKLILTPYNEDGTPLWPEVFPEEKLDRICSELKPYLWACLMLQDPMPPESAVSFHEEWIKEFPGPEAIPPGSAIAITVDPAFSKNWAADRTSIACTAVPPDGGLYVLQMKSARLTPHEIADTVFAMADFWESKDLRPEFLGVEGDVGGMAIINVMKHVRNERGRYDKITKLSSGQASKPSRIAELSGYAEMYGIYILSTMGTLRHNILRYPVGKHDDDLDALAHRVRKLSKNNRPLEEPQAEEISNAIVIKPLTFEDVVGRRFEKPMDLMRIF